MKSLLPANSKSLSAERRFQKTIEDFICGHCGFKVTGNGYTNHCPNCLFSKHVDINPGDRRGACGGLMEPVAVEIKSSGYTLVHQCQKCGIKKKNKASNDDSIDAIIKLSQSIAKI